MFAKAVIINVYYVIDDVVVYSTELKLAIASLFVLNARIFQFCQELLYFVIALIALFILAILITFSSKKGIAVFGWVTFGFFVYCMYNLLIATSQYQSAIRINTGIVMESVIDLLISINERNIIIICLLLLHISYDAIPIYLYYLLAGLGISVILTVAVNVSSPE